LSLIRTSFYLFFQSRLQSGSRKRLTSGRRLSFIAIADTSFLAPREVGAAGGGDVFYWGA